MIIVLQNEELHMGNIYLDTVKNPLEFDTSLDVVHPEALRSEAKKFIRMLENCVPGTFCDAVEKELMKRKLMEDI